ncbi:two-component system phosphate regulon sensor histidine kinase PhoR [Chitinophaga skermanii]|uniref:histidine kinase n=1 Tax=Chitinophaga skermanii TaxID=331697 RepID=A0A327R454_9BACT|nr:HAMP domain-containing sensor histidine kinase [Chitinophaga skermanii]RAJ10828.1 two-component system phosphate regulon sensor histidine kinase PhoR [Chitinophaga skermanii]
MWPLKKIFPVIIILITLSLLGSIAIQVNWITNAVHLRKESYQERMQEVVAQVASNLYDRTTRISVRTVRMRSSIDPTGNRVMLEGFTSDPTTYKMNQYSVVDVRAMIDSALRKQKIKAEYEFGIESITPFGNTVKVASRNFPRLRAELDSSVYLAPFVSPIVRDLSELTDSPDVITIIVPKPNLLKSLGLMIVGNVLFTIIIIAAFSLTVRTMFSQKKLSEIKSDFINNMTHELKTPLATISLAIDAIGNEKVMDNKDKIRYFSGIIKEENKRMNRQVETILQSAQLEKDELEMKKTVIDVHQLINKTVDNLQLQLDNKSGKVELQLDAHQPIISADEVHFSNLIFNLLDNAIKYSKEEGLLIKIQTQNTRKSLQITIADNGIGMSKDTVSRIFEKFYRAHTGNVHNVKGFGLGLAYVKAIVDAHKGKIKVESTIGKGSKFILEFPQD